MFLGTFENQNEFCQPSADNSQFLLPLHFSLQHNTLEHILNNIAPDCSKISICTQEDRNIETFSVSDDFLAESDDHFYGPQHNDELQHAQMVKEQHIYEQQMKQVKEVKLEEQQGQEYKQQKEQAEREQSCHDQTKNIPKNYIKAIFSFILENPHIMANISPSAQNEVERLSEWVRVEKRIKRYTIERLKSLWMGECGKAMRVISCYFLRKRSVGYIFGSKIDKKMAHIRHRYKLISAIGNPVAFSSIK